jgi:hypothetical protein
MLSSRKSIVTIILLWVVKNVNIHILVQTYRRETERGEKERKAKRERS